MCQILVSGILWINRTNSKGEPWVSFAFLAEHREKKRQPSTGGAHIPKKNWSRRLCLISWKMSNCNKKRPGQLSHTWGSASRAPKSVVGSGIRPEPPKTLQPEGGDRMRRILKITSWTALFCASMLVGILNPDPRPYVTWVAVGVACIAYWSLMRYYPQDFMMPEDELIRLVGPEEADWTRRTEWNSLRSNSKAWWRESKHVNPKLPSWSRSTQKNAPGLPSPQGLIWFTFLNDVKSGPFNHPPKLNRPGGFFYLPCKIDPILLFKHEGLLDTTSPIGQGLSTTTILFSIA